MGVLSAEVHISNETAMHAKAQASNRMAKANRASHGPRVRAIERVKNTMENPKEKSKGGSHKGKTSKTGLSGLGNSNRRQARKLRNFHRHVHLTLPGTMVGMVTNGTMTDF